ncbi:NAD(P)-dependent alcohol dehydrogenase [Paenibacillus lautus]|uniref:NAD(P)-dependent alcohol dehydrogenase n=1 Tax=Paenibacillus lautus TaxID=1401 RepID=UPI002040C506|nr:NAD(P)-dependent alcohol dehydrogenase [Paenibacillus lautus]MCM3257860.1 NAD(P)-dependent alcohol dehydrogenase [Paenibacillus lautus]
MKAMVCTKYGSPDVLELTEVNKPVPMANEVLVRIRATSVAAMDVRIRSSDFPLLLWIPMRFLLGFRKPKKTILGVELSGIIEDVGKDVKRFKKGDEIMAYRGMNFGTYAEYTCLHEDGMVVMKPINSTYEEAAAFAFGGLSALYFLKKSNIQSGQRVLIYGASGAVGSSAVQLAKHFGTEVTGVTSTTNIDLVKTLGADLVVDYTTENFVNRNERYDVIFDAVGKISKARSSKVLAPNGTYVSVDGQGIAKVSTKDLHFLKELMEKGKLKSVIDRCYPLEQIPEAHRYAETGRKKGNVAITVGECRVT